MSRKQNPTTNGDRVLWSALTRASTEPLTILIFFSRCLTLSDNSNLSRRNLHPIFFKWRAMRLVAPANPFRRNSSSKNVAVLRLTGKGKKVVRSAPE